MLPRGCDLLYEQLQGGGGASTQADHETIKSRFKTTTPVTFREFESGLVGYLSILEVFLGASHSVTTSLRRFYDKLLVDSETRRELTDLMDRDRTAAHTLALDIHLQTYTWLCDQRQVSPAVFLSAPSYSQILEDFRVGRWQKPDLQRLGFAGPSAPLPPAAPSRPTPLSPPVTSGAAGGNNGSSAGNLMRNESPHADVPLDARFNVRTLRTEREQANISAPKIGDVEICLAFHKKGVCFDNCRRCVTHRPLSGPEAAALKSYLEGASTSA